MNVHFDRLMKDNS